MKTQDINRNLRWAGVLGLVGYAILIWKLGIIPTMAIYIVLTANNWDHNIKFHGGKDH
jgi:hypothetical protein